MNTQQVLDILAPIGSVSTLSINNLYREFVVRFPLLPGEETKQLTSVARVRAMRKNLMDAIGSDRLRSKAIVCVTVYGFGKLIMQVKVTDA